ncbi:hypothetical protein POM88_020041 [Heracleum sosnowskyi]|uniref:Uncharacterized protein n=1 Tax=Heracleum sosnowskyi TaxID=360622 RepID=A0AAD8MR34_9APIA|nr:hypothetical protein POM88_020041 [Heracleum sosnowskyi]
MHDLLRDLGRNVARNKAPDEPEKYSRLWVPEDIEDVLKNHTGTSDIKTMWDLSMVSHVFGNGLARRHLTKRLVKVYSEFGHQISVYVSEFVDDQKIDPQWSDWILESPYWTSGELSESTKLYAHLLPNESRNFMGIILCFIRSTWGQK